MASELSRNWLAQARSHSVADAPGWFAALRARGVDRFETLGLPDHRVENWKYTSLRALERSRPELAGAAGQGDLPPALSLSGLHLRMLDGALAESVPPTEGFTVSDLESALANDDGILQSVLESLPLDSRGAGFSALNTAVLDNGLVIRVDAGRDAGRVILQWGSSAAAAGRLGNSRVCVLLGAGARLELVEHYSDGTVPGILNTVIQTRLDDNAQLTHFRLQELNPGATLVTRTLADQSTGSRYRYHGLDIGGGLVRHDLDVRLQGSGSRCDLDGAYVLDGRRHVDNHLSVDHIATETTSSQFFRGVLTDRGRAVFNGRAHIFAGADGSEVRQSNANMLLSAHAVIDTKPELEIHADEVVASHGATVGALDDAALFYLRSRGLSEAGARHMLTNAFCVAALERAEAGEPRALLIERLRAHLPGGAL
jgi:Fe-S cluster assembly protein SufD